MTGHLLICQPYSGSGAEATYHDDFLELIRADVAISIFIKIVERLTEPFSLVTLDHLRELVICSESAVSAM